MKSHPLIESRSRPRISHEDEFRAPSELDLLLRAVRWELSNWESSRFGDSHGTKFAKIREYHRMIYENLFSVREYRSLIGFMFFYVLSQDVLVGGYLGHDSMTMVMTWPCSTQVVGMVTGGSRLLHWVLHVTPQLLGGSRLALKVLVKCGQQRLVKILGSWSCFGELGLPWSFLMVPTWTL